MAISNAITSIAREFNVTDVTDVYHGGEHVNVLTNKGVVLTITSSEVLTRRKTVPVTQLSTDVQQAVKRLFTKLVVTRHQSLVEYLLEIGIIAEGEYELVTHASPDNVTGRHVVGVLPHSLSCLTETFTEVPLVLPAELRGKELTIEDMRMYSKPPVTYKVTVV